MEDMMAPQSSEPVLLVESDLDARNAMASILRTRHAVTDVGTGAAALEWLAAGDLPCIIMFVLRAGDDSGEFRNAQQAEPKWASIPTILFSAQAGAPSTVLLDTLLTLVGRHCERTVH
jgi:CheY-like chemotaxis protein